MRLLVVEDDLEQAQRIKQQLRSHFVIDLANNADGGLFEARTNSYQIATIDLGLPDFSGIELIQKIRADQLRFPILVLSGFSAPHEIAHALNCGADDYVIKPYAQIELMARLRALLRRPPQHNHNYIKWRGITLDSNTKTLIYQNKHLKLKNKQYLIMECLLQRANSITTRQILANCAWELAYVNRGNLDCQISLLRKRIRQNLKIKLIHTEHGVGYSLKIQTNQGSNS